MQIIEKTEFPGFKGIGKVKGRVTLMRKKHSLPLKRALELLTKNLIIARRRSISDIISFVLYSLG